MFQDGLSRAQACENLTVDGIHGKTLCAVIDQAKRLEFFEEWLAIDLTLGGWRARQAAMELSEQLGIELPPAAPTSYDISFDSMSAIIGAGVDGEAQGNLTVRTAFRDASVLSDALRVESPREVLIFAPRFGFPWRMENEYFLKFLFTQASPDIVSFLVVCAEPESTTHPTQFRIRWLNEQSSTPLESSAPEAFSFFPGLVPSMHLSLFAYSPSGKGITTKSLRHGLCLVAPECRKNPSQLNRNLVDRFAVQANELPWLQAFGQRFGNNLFVDPLGLAQQAWQNFSEGSREIALDHLDRAVECATTSNEKAICQIQAQGMRIATGRFQEAANLPDPAGRISSELRNFLMQTKGWGLVMSGNADKAEKYFRDLHTPLKENPTHLADLYLLNIYALSRLRGGDLEGAMALEKRIENALSGMDNPDSRLQYLNKLNMARLYRKKKDGINAKRYFASAFETTQGVQSEGDAIQRNAVAAHLEMDRQNGAMSFCYLVRTALYWVCSEPAEMLGERVFRAILPSLPTQSSESPTDIISRWLLTELKKEFNPSQEPSIFLTSLPNFARIECGVRLGEGAIVGMPGWSVILADNPHRSRVVSDANLPLLRFLWILIQYSAPTLDLRHVKTIFLDDRSGREMAQDRCELLETSIRLGFKKICYSKKALDLDKDTAKELELMGVVSLGPAVSTVNLESDRPYVTYKRYLAPRDLSVHEANLLKNLQPKCTVADLLTGAPGGETTAEVLRRLESDRIIVMKLPEGACTRVGIR